MRILTTYLVAIAALAVTGNETGGRGQVIDPGPKKNDYALIFDTGGIKLPPDGKKSDLFAETGGILPGGGGKKVDRN